MQCVLYFTIKYLFTCIPNLLLKNLIWAKKFWVFCEELLACVILQFIVFLKFHKALS